LPYLRRISLPRVNTFLAKPRIAPHLSPMPEITARLTAALADRYTIERELGAGGMACCIELKRDHT